MNGINQHNEIDRNTKFWVWEGYYCPMNLDYHEKYAEEVVLGDLCEFVVRGIDLDHDISIVILYDTLIKIIAKNVHDLDRYKEIMGANYIKWLLDERSKEDMPDEACFWETYDFPASI